MGLTLPNNLAENSLGNQKNQKSSQKVIFPKTSIRSEVFLQPQTSTFYTVRAVSSCLFPTMHQNMNLTCDILSVKFAKCTLCFYMFIYFKAAHRHKTPN